MKDIPALVQAHASFLQMVTGWPVTVEITYPTSPIFSPFGRPVQRNLILIAAGKCRDSGQKIGFVKKTFCEAA